MFLDRRFTRACALTAVVLCAGLLRPMLAAQEPALSVRITSPLGRTGLSGPIRIVAQIHHPPATPPGEVRFYVDGKLLQSVVAAPYAVEWVDDNPFERREITVEAVTAGGQEARDAVVLQPLEVVENTEVASVLLEASIQDESGRFVRGLPSKDLAVLEDGVPQALDLLRQEAVGATFALLVDSSASMSRRMDFVQRTATTLSGYMTTRDRMLVAPFSRTIGATTGPTMDHQTIVEAIDAIRPSGGTAILDSIAQVAHSLASMEGRRAIVLITDGYDEHSTGTFEDTLTAVKEAGATLYVVGIGGVAGISIRGERLLRRLAVESGGRFFFPSRDEQLEAVHETLTDDVQNRYLIAYTPTNQKVDGSWRAITVRTSHPDYVVRARPGYFAPKPAPIRPNIEFTATDVDGRYLDLTADDLEVLENGDVQRIDRFTEAVQPVSIVLALDSSGSMKKKEADVVESARRFVDALRPEDRLAIITFADKPYFAHALSTNREFSHDAIKVYKANGGTALFDALSDSLLHVRSAGGRRVVVVMTDGRDENNAGTAPGSVRRLPDVLKLAKESGATIFTIGLGTNVDRTSLTQLADMTGGQALFPTDVTQLDAEYRRVAEDLRRRYVLGFTSSHTLRDGSWRDVEIRVKASPDATVRSAGGYFAPAK